MSISSCVRNVTLRRSASVTCHLCITINSLKGHCQKMMKTRMECKQGSSFLLFFLFLPVAFEKQWQKYKMRTMSMNRKKGKKSTNREIRKHRRGDEKRFIMFIKFIWFLFECHNNFLLFLAPPCEKEEQHEDAKEDDWEHPCDHCWAC